MSMAVAAGTVFVGTRDEGVWRSDDDGQSWEASGTGSEGLEIVFLEDDPVDPSGGLGRHRRFGSAGERRRWRHLGAGRDRSRQP